MQGDDRLAGSGATLHDEHTSLWRADDLVLLALDRGDDVAERAGSAALERSDQGAVAAQPGGRAVGVGEPLVVAEAEMALAEQLVLDAEQVAALDGEVTAAGEAHRLAPRGAVERFGDRRPPVDHDRFGIRVGDSEPADVEALQLTTLDHHPVVVDGMPIDPTEHECGIAEIEVGQTLDQGLVERIPLETGLKRAAQVGFGEVTQPPRRATTLFETIVGVVDVGLFVGEIRMVLRHRC